MECGKPGHFKCTSENRSRHVKLTFDVADNLNEFFVDDEIRTSPKSSLTKKREDKRQRKEAKKHRHRRLSNSNLMIPTTDEEFSDYSRSSSSTPEEPNQCPSCAGKHDYEDCRNKSVGNQKYLHYENVRNRFAKDVGFNYRSRDGRDGKDSRDGRDYRDHQGKRYVDYERMEVEDRDHGWDRKI